MKFAKKSLGQNFLIDKNIINKIINLVNIKNRNIIEIGPGTGSLTNEILKKNPKNLLLIEKDKELVKRLKSQYIKNENVKLYEADVLKFDLEKKIKKDSIIFGNLPYNISSQILVRILKSKILLSYTNDIILMFQKELGERIVSKYPSKNYGRLSILSNYKLNVINKFTVSQNCFIPRPKVISLLIHFQTKKKFNGKIKKIENLEKITNMLFSNKRKMINKNIKKILDNEDIRKINGLKLNCRPSEIKPDVSYTITEIFENR